MKLDYIPLASVPTAESLGASAKVLVVDDGEIKKTAKANVGEHPSGKLTITGTSEVNCAAYATAQVSDENLVAGNIKKDVVILGTTGSYEGSGGITYASVALTLTPPQGVEILEISYRYIMTVDGAVFMTEGEDVTGSTASVPMYGGAGGLHSIIGFDANSSYAMDESITPVCTGGVSWDSSSHSFTVTGNGTITATLTNETPK